ncbi:MAG TPA: FHA domain-containing protein [Chromatiales bacterium]|nr:FHA domain-containing protein [Chromatiales bacterium]
MAKLIVTRDGGIVGEYPILKECLTIGRRPGNDVVLDHPAVSSYHAQVITLLNESFVEDLESTNGTFVNGRLIRKHALRDGDVITLGEHRITYVNELARSAGDMQKTTVLGKVTAGAGQPEAPAAVIRILDGASSRVVRLTKPLTTVGKPDEAVAAITRRAKGYFIVGLEGMGDPRRMSINGEAIGDQAIALKDNDVIEIGGVKMQFNLD